MQRKRKDPAAASEMPSADRRWLIMIRQNSRPFAPPTDVIELADKVVVVVEIAGMRSSDLSITLHDQQLVISGTRERPQFTSAAYHQVEIGFGEFRVDINLPWSVDREAVTASYEAGFLQVELPRKSGRQIPIVDITNVE